jgi:hypothetical protein
MARITIPYTSYFGINTTKVPFENLDALNDTAVYLDPHAVRIIQNQFSKNAILAIDSFLDCLTGCILTQQTVKEHLFTHFNEPKETHLGLSCRGYYGHGTSGYLNSKIIEILSGKDLYPLLDIGVFKHLENLPIFIDGIGNDITSDITTCLIFDQLAHFTQDCMKKFPQLTSKGTRVVTKQIWNPQTLAWQPVEYVLPEIEGNGLVLIPTGWCQNGLSGTSERYYNLESLGYLQDRGPKTGGKPVTKKQLKKSNHDRIATNVRETTKAQQANRNLIKEFWEYVDSHDFLDNQRK